MKLLDDIDLDHSLSEDSLVSDFDAVDLMNKKGKRTAVEREVIEVKEKAIAQYKLINELCIENNTPPFFEDPTNIGECEKTRLDIVRIIPETILNEFFGVESIGYYEPPKLNGDK